MDPVPQQSATNNSVLKLIAFILFITLPILGFIFGMYYESLRGSRQDPKEADTMMRPADAWTPSVTSEFPSPTPMSQEFIRRSNICVKNGTNSVEYLLVPYEVKKNDTLLTIATKELKDPSRVQELAVMNGEKYPSLFSTPGVADYSKVLVAGWVFNLPPAWITDSSGQLDEVDGMILQIRPDDGWYEITSNTNGSGHFATIKVSQSMSTAAGGLKAGDCISAVRDIRKNSVLRISLQ